MVMFAGPGIANREIVASDKDEFWYDFCDIPGFGLAGPVNLEG